jgi:hypothetical protein
MDGRVQGGVAWMAVVKRWSHLVSRFERGKLGKVVVAVTTKWNSGFPSWLEVAVAPPWASPPPPHSVGQGSDHRMKGRSGAGWPEWDFELRRELNRLADLDYATHGHII